MKILTNISVMTLLVMAMVCCKNENQNERTKTVTKGYIKQIQYFDENNKVYKIENFKNNELFARIYLLKDKDSIEKDSIIYMKDSTKLVLKHDREDIENVFRSWIYDKNSLLVARGVFVEKDDALIPFNSWEIYHKGKISRFYDFYVTDAGICLTQIIHYDSNKRINSSLSHYVVARKQGEGALLTLYSCCYHGKELIINGDTIKETAKNQWYISSKYIIEKDSCIVGKIILDKVDGEAPPYLVSEKLPNLRSLELSKITYFVTEVLDIPQNQQ